MSVITIVFRLLLAVILSGLIGMERENKNRPAGFRTHILVCVGSALTMMISEDIFNRYRGLTNLDPARLGAQVISGIGFLGAGTIIRQGASVKGLTTAATLWAVSCVGLAVGIGFYWGAISGAVIIFVVLIVLGRLGSVLNNQAAHLILNIAIVNKPGKIGEIGLLLGSYGINIRNIEFVEDEQEDEGEAHLRLTLKLPHGLTHQTVIKNIADMDGIIEVTE